MTRVEQYVRYAVSGLLSKDYVVKELQVSGYSRREISKMIEVEKERRANENNKRLQ